MSQPSRTIRGVTISVEAAAFGPEAYACLARAVAAAKRDDPLNPVTVVVPVNSVGVAARRHLARQGGGVAGITLATLYRVAELLGGARVAASGRRPVSSPTLGAAARAALVEVPGRFAPVADHPATETALVRAHRELDSLDGRTLEALARASGRARDVVALHRAMRRILEPRWSTERDLLDAAAVEADARGPLVAGLGEIVVFLPVRWSAPARRLVHSLGAAAPTRVIVGLSGNERLDAGALELGRDLDPELTVPVVPVPIAHEIVSVSDPDDEARAVVRLVLRAADDGTPLERMAVVFANREPYARLLHENLRAAGVPHNGVAVRSVADSVAGRTVREAFALADRDLRRSEVLAFASTAPVRFGGRPVPARAWERLSRRAGVVAGLGQWHDRLARLRLSLVAAERSDDIEHLDELVDFVDRIADRLHRARHTTSWSGLVDLTRAVLHDHLPGDFGRRSWPEAEQRAHAAVELALDRLTSLDAIESDTDLDTFRRALDAELAADLERVGHIGEGVLVGSVHLAFGVELDAVFVVGMSEGGFPSTRRDDSLLPDSDRAVTVGELPDRRSRTDDDHRALLAVLAHTGARRVFLQPRGDLRRTTDRPPSRYALDVIEAIAGIRPGTEELPRHASASWLEFVPSFAAGLTDADPPATEQELRLQCLLADAPRPEALAGHRLVVGDLALARAIELLTARASDRFTRFDGDLRSRPQRPLVDPEVAVSPTRLSSYASCPFDYFLHYILRVELVEDPERIERIAPTDLGVLLHEVLEIFVREHLAAGGGKPPGEAWNASERARLHEIADVVCAKFEALGLTGRRLHWHRDRRLVHHDLDRFLAIDDQHRARRGVAPIAAEHRFGLAASSPAVPLTLRDGRTVRFAGAADRIDRATDGSLYVIDYKSGKPGNLGKLSETDPDQRGVQLQLPVYALAARAFCDAPDAAVTAAYRFVTARGQYREVELPLTPPVLERIDHVIGTIIDLAEGGVFPHRVDQPTSRGVSWPALADPTGLAQGDQANTWDRKRSDPALARYVALAFPEPGEPADAGEPGDARGRR